MGAPRICLLKLAARLSSPLPFRIICPGVTFLMTKPLSQLLESPYIHDLEQDMSKSTLVRWKFQHNFFHVFQLFKSFQTFLKHSLKLICTVTITQPYPGIWRHILSRDFHFASILPPVAKIGFKVTKFYRRSLLFTTHTSWMS